MNHFSKSQQNLCPKLINKLLDTARQWIASLESDGYVKIRPVQELSRDTWQYSLMHDNGSVVSLFVDFTKAEVRMWRNCKLIKRYPDDGEQMRES